MEFDIMAIKSVTFRILFSLTIYPQPIKQVVYEVYGDITKRISMDGMIRQLCDKGWHIVNRKGYASISDDDVRLLNDYERYIIAGDVSKLIPYGVTRAKIAKLVAEAKAVLV